jgi:two-component system alkaline phosphatase synthesis response regulator PhoP
MGPEGNSVKKILITDDEPDIIKVVKFRLIKLGYEVSTATNGREGLESVRAVKPDLVLLDFRMPYLNGDEVCREIKKDESTRHIPVILMTATIENAMVGDIQSMGADDFILKPFEPEVLIEKIRKLIG